MDKNSPRELSNKKPLGPLLPLLGRNDFRTSVTSVQLQPYPIVNFLYTSFLALATFTSVVGSNRTQSDREWDPPRDLFHLPPDTSVTRLTVRQHAHTNCYCVISSVLALGGGQRKLLKYRGTFGLFLGYQGFEIKYEKARERNFPNAAPSVVWQRLTETRSMKGKELSMDMSLCVRHWVTERWVSREPSFATIGTVITTYASTAIFVLIRDSVAAHRPVEGPLICLT
ncbi:hypothetical protein WN48_07643 [Eufriesea mexicana]|uniref:Uncharacterized protein n=1 Tax=Eufriesea mexicana TaxID=516756 RepID=A0A310SLJ3_9HYME|nr:hypothetical protein WN48_07643 [Eufriesea mexicana]